jgi:hypothetical protein
MADQPTGPAPLVGQFKGPAQNSPRVARKEPPPPAEHTAEDEAIQESLDVLNDEVLNKKEKTPEEVAETYEEGLKSVDLTLEDARQIMEQILINNFYEETF